MKKSFDHTFIVMAYKDSQYLKECIISIKKQTIRSNIIITTSTPSRYLSEISNAFSIPIRINERNIIGSDWTFAYKNAETKYVTLAHQDDIYLSDYTEKCMEAAKKNEDSLILFTDYAEIIRNKIKYYSPNLIIKNIILLPIFMFSRRIHNLSLKRLVLSMGSPIPCPSVIFNKNNIGNFEFSTYFHFNLDWDAWLRLAKRSGSFVYIKKKLLLHRIHKDSQTTVCIESRWRHDEDKQLFNMIWPRSLAQVFSKIYLISYSSNKFSNHS